MDGLQINVVTWPKYFFHLVMYVDECINDRIHETHLIIVSLQ